MPISKAERNRLLSHTFSENKIDEFGGTHMVTPDISVAGTLGHSLRLLKSKPSALVLNIPAGIILALYVFAMFELNSTTNLIWCTAAFFVLEILVAAPLTAVAKAKFSDISITSLINPMLMSLNYLEPLVAIAYIGIMAVVIRNLTVITAFSALVFVLLIVVLVVAIILHVSNLNSSIAVHILYDKKLKRSAALGRSWMFISGQSLQMLAVNTIAFLPLIIAIVLDAALSKTHLILYLALMTFILADLCTSWWQACTSYVYTKIIKEAKPMRYSRL
jgi:hypothetical protein